MDRKFIGSEEEFLAHNLRWLRKRHGLSKRKMAACMSIGLRSLNQLEAGIIPPRLKISAFYPLYKYFHVTPSQLLTQWLDA